MRQGPVQTIQTPISHPEHTLNTKELGKKSKKMKEKEEEN
jgi:hypothetical protein